MIKDNKRLLSDLKVELFNFHFKVDKLGRFIKGKEFKKLSSLNQDLLVVQYNFMLGYEHVLQMRIDNNE